MNQEKISRGWKDQKLVKKPKRLPKASASIPKTEKKKILLGLKTKKKKRSKYQPKIKEKKFNAEYRAHINSSEWHTFRAKIIIERGCQCERCLAFGKVLHLHHDSYKRFGHEEPEDVRLLCVSCHEEVHGRKFV